MDLTARELAGRLQGVAEQPRRAGPVDAVLEHLDVRGSQVADDAWHAFILHTRVYQDFCNKAFGRFLHHTPAEAMRTPTLATEGIRRAWRLACALEKINPEQPSRLPRLFALDGALSIPNGFRYDTRCRPGSGSYCASDIGCGSGCGGGSVSDSTGAGCGGDGDGGGGCGGGD